MNIFSWNPELECGVPMIDEQHRTFFKHLNAFVIKARAGGSRAALDEQLLFLENYLLYHFQSEESYQKTSEYPLYRQHQASHNHIRYKVKSAIVSLKSKENPTYEEMEQLYSLMVDWTLTHIEEEDMHFSRFYREYLKTQQDGQ